MFNTPELKVGLLVVTVSALIGFMSLRVSDGPGLLSGKKEYYFDVDSAGGLIKNSAVKMAGIKVGVIDEIELVNGRARIHVVLSGDVPMHSSAVAGLKADGILGDKHVAIDPGELTDPPLENGSAIKSMKTSNSLDQVMEQVGGIADSLKEVAEIVERAVGQGDKETTLGRVMVNIENLTRDLSEMSGENKDKIGEIVEQVRGITSTLDQFINDDSPEGFKAAWKGAVSSLENIDKTLRNAEEITDKINRGEGTIGRLVNDEETVDGINTAIANVNDFLGGAGAMETSIDFHSEYLSQPGKAKSYLDVKIQPGLDRYYILGIVDDPRGVSTNKSITTSTGGGPSSTTDEEIVNKGQLKFNALFAKNFYNFTLKGGIMQNEGGVGVDYYLLGKKMRFSVEAVGFSNMNLRSFLRYDVVRGIYLIGGGDELSNSTLRSGFVGAGLFITNDDLKTFASSLSF